MQRVAIVGSGGAGKSTLARQLGDALGLPVVHLDREFWRPGWKETPTEEWQPRVAELAAGDRWIIDGNYGGTLDLRVKEADTVVFLDLPRTLCLYRIVKRALSRRPRLDMADGCPERLDRQFVRWVWRYPIDSRPKVEAAIERHGRGAQVIRLRSRREVRDFVGSVTRHDRHRP